jgi:hypothetical protein
LNVVDDRRFAVVLSLSPILEGGMQVRPRDVTNRVVVLIG